MQNKFLQVQMPLKPKQQQQQQQSPAAAKAAAAAGPKLGAAEGAAEGAKAEPTYVYLPPGCSLKEPTYISLSDPTYEVDKTPPRGGK
jgi:hypothetical protein